LADGYKNGWELVGENAVAVSGLEKMERERDSNKDLGEGLRMMEKEKVTLA
jgi:hypothetical protein